jgi:hypothetical protein
VLEKRNIRPIAANSQRHDSVDRTLFMRWITEIHDRLADNGHTSSGKVRVTRFVNSLHCARDGRVFAILRTDTNGLFFREWSETGESLDQGRLTMVDARTLIERSLQRAR